MSEEIRKNESSDVVDALRSYLVRGSQGVNQSTVAKAIGVSNTIISQLLSGKYKGDVAGVAEKIRQFLAREKERKAMSHIQSGFAITAQAADALSVITFCHIHRKMGVIHAPAGIGKTMALRHYAAENTAVRIITCRAGMSQRELLDEILEEMGKQARGTNGKIIKAICDELEGAELVLICDEAQHLGLASFEALRYIHDRTQIPVVFCGTDDIVDRMTGRKNLVYDQIFSRVAIRRRLKVQIRRSDVEALLATAGDLTAGKEIVDFLFQVAQKRGYYRTMMSCLTTARIMAAQQGESLAVPHLTVASQFLWEVAS